MTDQLIYNAICTPSGDCIYNPFYFRDCIYLLLYCISLKQEGLYTQSLNCQHAYTNSENNLISTRTQLKRTTLTQHIFQITILTSHFHKHYYIVSTSKFTQNLVLEIVNMQCTITKCNHLTHVYCLRHSVHVSCVIHISQPLSSSLSMLLTTFSRNKNNGTKDRKRLNKNAYQKLHFLSSFQSKNKSCPLTIP